jgi:hypothetical protein
MSTLFISALLALQSPSDQVFPITREPRPARPWIQSLSLTCGDTTYRISGYGAAFPPEQEVVITANRRRLRGEAAERLKRDLSRRGAVYRIVGLCSGNSINLIVYRGEVGARGTVSYESGSAAISRAHGLWYGGLEPSSEDGFWFR